MDARSGQYERVAADAVRVDDDDRAGPGSVTHLAEVRREQEAGVAGQLTGLSQQGFELSGKVTSMLLKLSVVHMEPAGRAGLTRQVVGGRVERTAY
ncbi:hypothetical protein, partial [Frankia sp. CpI1-P]|uniref:hypothetical protein n=1 Tax=Frankia sp. CpI1-P TaxID=1502734 RepID=UPI001A7E978A